MTIREAMRPPSAKGRGPRLAVTLGLAVASVSLAACGQGVENPSEGDIRGTEPGWEWAALPVALTTTLDGWTYKVDIDGLQALTFADDTTMSPPGESQVAARVAGKAVMTSTSLDGEERKPPGAIVESVTYYWETPPSLTGPLALQGASLTCRLGSDDIYMPGGKPRGLDVSACTFRVQSGPDGGNTRAPSPGAWPEAITGVAASSDAVAEDDARAVAAHLSLPNVKYVAIGVQSYENGGAHCTFLLDASDGGMVASDDGYGQECGTAQ